MRRYGINECSNCIKQEVPFVYRGNADIIMRNNPCHIDVYILHSELTDKDIQRLKDCLDKYDVTIYLLYIEKDKFAGRMYTDKMWSIEAYYRLML